LRENAFFASPGITNLKYKRSTHIFQVATGDLSLHFGFFVVILSKRDYFKTPQNRQSVLALICKEERFQLLPSSSSFKLLLTALCE
jgi:hypothetical protein